MNNKKKSSLIEIVFRVLTFATHKNEKKLKGKREKMKGQLSQHLMSQLKDILIADDN